MTSPINPFNRSTAANVGNSAVKANEKQQAPAAKSNSSPANDTVSLSDSSQQVISLQQQLKNAPEVDSAKVEAIKQEIANGNYPLDAEKIAENMINLEKSLLE